MARILAALRASMFAAAPLLMVGCAAEVGQSSQAIFGGVEDSTHTNVVGIAIVGGGGFGTCTGSLIAPNLVLTARHCVSEISGDGIVCSRFTQNGTTYEPSLAAAPYSAGTFAVTTDQAITQSARYYRVAEVWVPENTTNQPMCGRDIALLRLTGSIPGITPIEPRLDIAPRVNDTFTASGFGATNGRGGGSGTRRMREGLTVQHVGLAQARPGLTVLTAEEWLADTGTCQGDSGGPALDETGAVFGILSRGDANSCNSPVYTRVDSYAAWIRERARAAATAGRYTPPSWVEPPQSRPGVIGDECRTDEQCDIPLLCLAIGTSRRCTSEDCTACPGGWVCNDTGRFCIPDPALPPPPPADSGVPAADAGASPDGGAPPGAMSGGCSVDSRSQRSGGLAAIAGLALALAATRRRRR
ncbi:MAG: S1 family peptidase [Myxococcales bacterium]|nr:S1 family peptidase [Myxococcales bacterium]